MCTQPIHTPLFDILLRQKLHSTAHVSTVRTFLKFFMDFAIKNLYILGGGAAPGVTGQCAMVAAGAAVDGGPAEGPPEAAEEVVQRL